MMNLETIPLDKYSEFATNLFTKFGKEIGSEAITLAYNTFEGNTYYVQKVLHEAFNLTEVGMKAETSMMEGIIHSMSMPLPKKVKPPIS